MSTWIVLLLIGITSGLLLDLMIRKRMNKYWSRSCTGAEWKRQFSDVGKDDIREFLEQFVTAFCFSSKKKLKFSPNDKILDIYRALYPTKEMPDALELETFVKNLKIKYKIDMNNIWHDDLTLGELFTTIRHIQR